MDYRQAAINAANRYGIPSDLFLRQIQQESGFNPNAVSSAGAIGLGQLMPETARELGVDPNDPLQNLDGAARYMSQQLRRFKNPALALAAYNAGPSRVVKANGIPDIAETKNYVSAILGEGDMNMNGQQPMTPNLSFSEEDFAKQEKSAKRKDMAGAFASWLNSMSINPDPNLPQVVQAAQARRADELKNNRTVNLLEQSGRNDIAKLVKAGVITGREGAKQLFDEAAAVRAQKRAMELELFKTSLASGLPAKPLTQLAKLKSDYEGGRLTQQEYEAAVQAYLTKNKMSIRQNADGSIEFVQGGDLSKLTEAQSKDINWAIRMKGALEDFEPIASELTNIVGNLAQLDPTKLSRYMQSDDFQRAIVAGKEFLAPLVRKDTGAAVTNREWELYSDIYIPQVGDGAAKLQQKAIARRRALEALQAGLPPQFVLNEQYAGRDPLKNQTQLEPSETVKSDAVPRDAVTIGGYVIEPINNGEGR